MRNVTVKTTQIIAVESNRIITKPKILTGDIYVLRTISIEKWTQNLPIAEPNT